MWLRTCWQLLSLFLFGLALHAESFHAGLTEITFHPTAHRNWRGAQTEALHCLLWYPAVASAPETAQSFTPAGMPPIFRAGKAARNAAAATSPGKLPLIVMSHGLGGSADQFGWLAPELARHGYLVVAVNHPGNNALEPYTPEGFLLWWERATDISEVLDGMLADPRFGARIDQARIGALGYSIGGETVLALAGARIDQPAFVQFCLAHPEQPTCHPPSLAGALSPQELLSAVQLSSAESLARSGESYRDARIRAVFALAPAAGQAFHASSFSAVDVPITMVAGAADTVAPPEVNAEQFGAWMPQAKVAVMKGVGHYTFLDSCTAEGTQFVPQLCAEPAGADREAVHRKTVAMAASFFDKNLPAGTPEYAIRRHLDSRPSPGQSLTKH